MPKKKNETTIRSSAAEYLTYVAAVGDNPESVEVRYEDENIWLTQKMLATLYNVNVATINEHIANIYRDNELEKDSTIRNFLIVQKEGNREVSRNIAHWRTSKKWIFERILIVLKENLVMPNYENCI